MSCFLHRARTERQRKQNREHPRASQAEFSFLLDSDLLRVHYTSVFLPRSTKVNPGSGLARERVDALAMSYDMLAVAFFTHRLVYARGSLKTRWRDMRLQLLHGVIRTLGRTHHRIRSPRCTVYGQIE